MSYVSERYYEDYSADEARRVHALNKAIESHDYPTTTEDILSRGVEFEECLKGASDD